MCALMRLVRLMLAAGLLATAATWSCIAPGTADQGGRTTEGSPAPLPAAALVPDAAPDAMPAAVPAASPDPEPTAETTAATTPETPAAGAAPDPDLALHPLRRGRAGTCPPRVRLDGVDLGLQGIGLCEWGFLGIDLYHGALYVERALGSAAEAVQAEQPLLICLDFVRSLSAAQLREAFQGSAKANCGASLPQYADALAQLCAAMADVDDGDCYAFFLRPGRGLDVLRNGKPVATIADEAFRRLFARLYFGDKPPTKSLKKAMLGSAQ